MFAFEIPGLQFSLPAGGAVERHRFVSVNSSGNGVQATASTVVVGASTNKVTVDDSSNVAPAGQVIEVADGLVIIEAAAAITAGVAVASDANGKAIAYASGTTGDACGVAITAAAAAGEFITVKIH